MLSLVNVVVWYLWCVWWCCVSGDCGVCGGVVPVVCVVVWGLLSL